MITFVITFEDLSKQTQLKYTVNREAKEMHGFMKQD